MSIIKAIVALIIITNILIISVAVIAMNKKQPKTDKVRPFYVKRK